MAIGISSSFNEPEWDQIADNRLKLENQKLRRMVELYNNGKLYEDVTVREKTTRLHVGFRYDLMSDDDYFELVELEESMGYK